MGTTSTVMLLVPQGAVLAHVGDSRAYRLRSGRFEQLTFDHSLVWELKRAGQLPEGKDAEKVPKNVITRSLGPNPTVQVDLEGPLPVQPGDAYLLCSDGLWNDVAKEEMVEIIEGTASPQDACDRLIDKACERGVEDNITVLMAKIH